MSREDDIEFWSKKKALFELRGSVEFSNAKVNILHCQGVKEAYKREKSRKEGMRTRSFEDTSLFKDECECRLYVSYTS